MPIIQLKRRMSADASGPVLGSNATIYSGEPMVDLLEGRLYVSKFDKTNATVVKNDYLVFSADPLIEALMNSKITALGLGTAATKNTGTTSGMIPILDSSGKLVNSVQAVYSVNGKTGAVTISLSDLNGVSTSTFTSHENNGTHFSSSMTLDGGSY